MNHFSKILKNPKLLFFTLGYRGFLGWLRDETYLKIAYRIKFGKKLNLENPKTFSEKLQWIKLFDRNPLYTQLVDKYEVKKFIADKIGSDYIIPTLGVWNHFDEINFEKLPNQFVLKCTHDSGGLIICKDKSKIDIEKSRKKMEASLKRSFYDSSREWPYKNVKPRIIAETYMEDSETGELRDYKIFAFNGTARALFVATDRQKNSTKFDFFDMNYKHLDIKNGHPNADVVPACPKNLKKMQELAEKLSEGIPQVRVDFYEVNGKIYFGEMTFFHWSGLTPFEPESWDYVFGSWIDLKKV